MAAMVETTTTTRDPSGMTSRNQPRTTHEHDDDDDDDGTTSDGEDGEIEEGNDKVHDEKAHVIAATTATTTDERRKLSSPSLSSSFNVEAGDKARRPRLTSSNDLEANSSSATQIRPDTGRTFNKRPLENRTTGGNNNNNNGINVGLGAVYMPPAKRRQLAEALRQQQQQQQQQDSLTGAEREGDNDDDAVRTKTKTSIASQRETWQDQKRIIHGTINRMNAGTIKPLIQELFQNVNLIRLRGVLCKSALLASVSSPKYSNVYAALIAVINSKLPEVGELMVKRSILAFRRYYKQRDRANCQAVCTLLVHLFHQGVVHELIILQLLSVLLDGTPTDDSVEVAIHVLQISGQALLESSPAGVRACTERLRSLLHEGTLNKRVEYRVEELLKVRKTGFKDFPPIIPELDLVERDDQITFELTLDDTDIRKEDELDVFSADPDYDEHEEEWKAIRGEILGEGDSDDDDDGSDDDDSSDGSSSNENENDEPEVEEIPDQELAVVPAASRHVAVVQDLTEADLVHLRRMIYLTIMSSATFEECAHKLARIDIPPGRESELINMLIECCSQERTFLRYYGLIASRFCLLDHRWRDAFMEAFAEQYNTIHRLETNKLRNVAKLFAHLLHTDSTPWSVMSIIHLNEDETTSSSRIFIKIVIQEIAEAMGIAKLKQRFETEDEEQKLWFAGMFPKDNVRNTRYAINFFTSIGLGPLTDDLREFLKDAPKLIMAQAKEAMLAKKQEEDQSDESSSVSSTSSSSSSSLSTTSSSSSSSSYTSSSSYSSSSSSSYSSRSSDSDSRRRRSRGGGRSSRRDRGRRSIRGRRDYSSSSSRSRSASSGTSVESRDGRNRKSQGRSHRDASERDRRDNTREKDEGRSSRRGGRHVSNDAPRRRRSRSSSRSESPPNEIVRKDREDQTSESKVSSDRKRTSQKRPRSDDSPRR